MAAHAPHSFLQFTATAPAQPKCAILGAAPSIGEPSSLFADGFSSDMHMIADFDAQRALASLEAFKGELS